MTLKFVVSIISLSIAMSFHATAQDRAFARIEQAFGTKKGITDTARPPPKRRALLSRTGILNTDTQLPVDQLTSTGEAANCAPVDTSFVRHQIQIISAEEGFDASLAEAVAFTESRDGKNPSRSSAGAMGIMQLMPGTADEMGVQDRCDTVANIRGGIRYLKKMRAEFGDPLLMLAAYNAGPQRVHDASGIPLNEETVRYVVKVLNRWKYAAIVEPNRGKSKTVSRQAANENHKLIDENQWKEGHVIEFE